MAPSVGRDLCTSKCGGRREEIKGSTLKKKKKKKENTKRIQYVATTFTQKATVTRNMIHAKNNRDETGLLLY